MKLANLLVVVLASTSFADEAFPTATLIADALDGEFRGHGDFDGDGDVDLIHFRQNGATWEGVTLFLNDGGGVFTPGAYISFAFPVNYNISPLDPIVGDFDGDGKLDFAINRDGSAFAVGEGVEYFLGDGAGAIASRVLHPMSGPRWMRAGNIDADAADELVISWINPSFERMIGWVDFQGGVPTQLPGTLVNDGVTPDPFVFAVLDVNGDGVDDVAATTSPAAGNHTLFFMETMNGVLSMGAQFSIPVSLQDVNHRIHAGDLDNDGDDDLLMFKMGVSDVGPWVWILERTPAGWAPRAELQTPRPTAGWIQPHYTQLADWNSDGWLDVITTSSTTEVLESNADWTFSEGFEATGTGQRGGGGAVDVNGDGLTDSVSGQAIQLGDGLFVGPDTVIVDLDIGSPLTPARLVDFEGDGDLDIVGDATGRVGVNDGAGGFSLAGEPTSPFASIFPALPQPLSWIKPIAYGDFDGNGRSEYLLTYGEVISFFQINLYGVASLEQDGLGSFSAPVPAAAFGDIIDAPPISSGETMWNTGDVDGDGDLDLLLFNGYRENNGAGRFDVFVAAWTGRGRLAADIDGDGLNDVVATRANGAVLHVDVHYAQGGTSTLSIANGNDTILTVRDLDGDQDLDLIVGRVDHAGLRLFENTGTSFAQAVVLLPLVVFSSTESIGVADADGDGELDVYVLREHSNVLSTIAIYRGVAGSFGFLPWREHLADATLSRFGDIDSDGDLDAIGSSLMLGTQIDGFSGGAIQQAETGVAGSGGFTPILGASGPVLSSTSTDQLRLVHGLGGSTFILIFGSQSTSLADQPAAGLELYVANAVVLPGLPLAGAAGVAGEGSASFPLPNIAALSGLTFHQQVFVFDPGAPAGWSASNRLTVTYGL